MKKKKPIRYQPEEEKFESDFKDVLIYRDRKYVLIPIPVIPLYEFQNN
jgi:hypothetical protein